MTVCGGTKVGKRRVLSSLHTTYLVSRQLKAVIEQLQSSCALPRVFARDVREIRRLSTCMFCWPCPGTCMLSIPNAVEIGKIFADETRVSVLVFETDLT